MDLPVELPPLDIPALLRQHGLHPDKRLGQNFLIDNASIRKVIEAARLQPGDIVLEIGAGLGNLTRHLAARARHVVAVELDKRLIPALRQVLEPFPNVTIVQGDILSLSPSDISLPSAEGSYLVVANIPYYITSALIRHLLEATPSPQCICLTVQLEVAERICASPGDLSLLALSVQLYGSPQIAARIPGGAFYPPPKVDSAVVRVNLYPQPVIPSPQIDTFFRLAKAGFNQKRKTLRNALANGMHLPASQVEKLLHSAGIEPQRRAETLSLLEWSALVEKHLSGAQ
jgi:16S rRNA (adenine1518-N6/adenine1519-N6)-dimethyltransferase